MRAPPAFDVPLSLFLVFTILEPLSPFLRKQFLSLFLSRRRLRQQDVGQRSFAVATITFEKCVASGWNLEGRRITRENFFRTILVRRWCAIMRVLKFEILNSINNNNNIIKNRCFKEGISSFVSSLTLNREKKKKIKSLFPR